MNEVLDKVTDSERRFEFSAKINYLGKRNPGKKKISPYFPKRS